MHLNAAAHIFAKLRQLTERPIPIGSMESRTYAFITNKSIFRRFFFFALLAFVNGNSKTTSGFCCHRLHVRVPQHRKRI